MVIRFWKKNQEYSIKVKQPKSLFYHVYRRNSFVEYVAIKAPGYLNITKHNYLVKQMQTKQAKLGTIKIDLSFITAVSVFNG